MRDKDYCGLRYHWLHELIQLRAKKRVHGATITKETKAIQRTLAKLRKDNPLKSEKKDAGTKLSGRKHTQGI
jgi:hypothetical protein